MNHYLSLDSVSLEYGGHIAIDDISLDIREGEFISLMGPSGCGKSSTLRVIAGLESPTSGDVRISGVSQLDIPSNARGTPMVWQNFALFPFMSVRQNVEFALKMRGEKARVRKRKSDEWLERMGLTKLADRNVEQLSGGQRQRVALARALVTEPRMLLLDEPLSALDAHLRVKMQTELSRLHKELGITFVYVTHSQSEALTMSDRVVVMNNGKIQQIGAPQVIYREPMNAFVAEFIGMNNLLEGTVDQTENGISRVSTSVGAFNVPTRDNIDQGDRVKMVVAADRIRLDGQGDQLLVGEINGEEFVGSTVTLFVELNNGSEFKIQKQQHEVEALELTIGKKLELSWESEHAFLVAA